MNTAAFLTPFSKPPALGSSTYTPSQQSRSYQSGSAFVPRTGIHTKSTAINALTHPKARLTPFSNSLSHSLSLNRNRVRLSMLAAPDGDKATPEGKTPKVGGERPANKPSYRVPAPSQQQGSRFTQLKDDLRKSKLTTVCEEAQCPNIGECWEGGKDGTELATATIMVLGDTCTRGCRFCAIATSPTPLPPDPNEPMNVALEVAKWGVDYIVITSVDRDDLPDGGSSHFSKTVNMMKILKPKLLVECLVSDFQGDRNAIKKLALSGLDVYAHNVETVERLQPYVRDRRANYSQSLETLRYAKEVNPKLLTKTSLMLGLGETRAEITQTLKDLRENGVDAVTFGQYLRPTPHHLTEIEWVSDETFAELKEEAETMGFKYVASGSMVRSSYKAGEYYMKSLLKG